MVKPWIVVLGGLMSFHSRGFSQSLESKINSLEGIVAIQQAELIELRKSLVQYKSSTNLPPNSGTQPNSGGSPSSNESICEDNYFSRLQQLKCRRCLVKHKFESSGYTTCMD